MFRISFGQRLVMIIAYVLLPVVSQPLTTLPKTAPLRPTATAPPQPSATSPPQPREAPPRPTATAPPQSTDSPQPSATAPPPPSEAPPQPREAPPQPSATASVPPPPSEAPPIPPPVPVLRVWPDHPSPGQTIKVDGEGRWPTGEMITVSLVISNEVNKVVSSETVHVGDNGTFTAFVTVPKDVEPGTPAIVDAVDSVSKQVFITIGGEV
jgi:hypothetical protein